MKKILIVMAVAALVLALVACGGETATTTEGTATTTTPVVTTGAPETTKAPETTAPETTEEPEPELPPVEAEIAAWMETAWWNQVHAKKPIQREKNADGSVSYVWALTIKAESGLFPTLPAEHEVYPGMPTIQLTTAEEAYVYIKDVNKDTDYTKYPVIASSWKTARWCDIWFEAEGFVPTADGEYDMFLFFKSPEYSTNPGEYVYIWALEDVWTYNAPIVFGDPVVDAAIIDGYRCSLHRHSERADVSYADNDNAPEGFDPATFPVNNFNFTIKAEDNLFPSGTDSDGNRTESFAEIIPEGAYAFVKGPDDTEFTRYECDYMLTERWCDMWFTLKDFTPEAGTKYEMVFCFMSGVSATHPFTLHYVYTTDWVAGTPAQ